MSRLQEPEAREDRWRPRVRLAGEIVGTLVLAVLAVALSSLLKHEFGAPNYGLGIVIGVALTCYLFGPVAAVAGLALALTGVYVSSIEVGDPSALPRLVTIIVTAGITSALVVLLQRARRAVLTRNTELGIVQQQLAQALSHQENIASTMQRAFLPQVPEHLGNVSISASYEAGSVEAEIGGDFYDVMQLSDTEVLIALGDVSGKGIQAARQAAGARYGLRSCILECRSPSEALRRLNSMLYLDPEFDGFVTLFVGVLDIASGRLTYSSGGHEPPILRRSDTGQCLGLKTEGFIVGAFAAAEFLEATEDLRRGDILLLFTDGLSEARRGSALLGFEGLCGILAASVQAATTNRLARVVGAARDYSGGKFRDDAAALLLEVMA